MSKVCVITGASGGLGKAMALQIAKKGYELILICRDRLKGIATAEEIGGITGNHNIRIINANLDSLEEVIRAAREIKSDYDKIDVLINNAAIFLTKLRLSKNRFEEQYAVNYLSAFVLTNELIELLNRSENPRVINLGSNMHRVGRISFPDPSKIKFYSGMIAYANTKLAMMMFSFELARRFPHIDSNAFHPGAVNTSIGHRNSHGISNYGWRLLSNFFISPAKGALTGVYLACAEEVKGKTGAYYYRKKIVGSSGRSRGLTEGKRLWDDSFNIWQNFKKQYHAEGSKV